VALPDNFGSGDETIEIGVVRLPNHVFWSGPERTWDLRDRRQRIQVYELVLTEGTEADVRRFINLDDLVELWTDLWLPPHVRSAWSNHLRRLMGLELAC
jgi:hypothetical protein